MLAGCASRGEESARCLWRLHGSEEKVEKCEGAQLDLVHTVEEVSSNASELAKSVSSWLPRYEAAARIVNDLSSKVERVEERFEGFSCDEGLVQRISRIAETKVEGLKELVSSSAAMEDIGQELRDLHERVESSDRVHCQVNFTIQQTMQYNDTKKYTSSLFGSHSCNMWY